MMRRAGVIILGILMVIGGSLWLFKDAYGKNIAGAAEDIAVNMVAVKINQSLKKGFCSETFEGQLLRVERDDSGNIQYIEPDTRLINRLVMDFAGGVKESYNPDEIARMILTLCTPVSDFMYGQTVEVDGGSQFSFQDKPWSYTMEGGLHA